MLKFKQSTLIALSGFIWLAVGLYLLPLGLHFLVDSAHGVLEGPKPLLSMLSSLGLEQAALCLVALGLGIGFIKGKIVFAKTVRKSVEHILSMSPPIPLTKVYSARYILLLAVMILLGVSLKFFAVPFDVRGLVDVAIGSALINGSMLYFRQAVALRAQVN